MAKYHCTVWDADYLRVQSAPELREMIFTAVQVDGSEDLIELTMHLSTGSVRKLMLKMNKFLEKVANQN